MSHITLHHAITSHHAMTMTDGITDHIGHGHAITKCVYFDKQFGLGGQIKGGYEF